MKRTFLTNLALVTGSTLLSLLIVEVVLRAFNPQIFEVSPGMYVEDSDIGYALHPDFEGLLQRSEFRTSFRINHSGLRGTDPRPRQSNTFRILVLGDSQAWGFGVADEETFSVGLEKELTGRYPERDIQVLNSGVPGYGTADQLAFLESKGPHLAPDLVIVQFLSVNDLLENRTPARDWAIVKDGRLTSRQGAESSFKRPTPAQWLIRRKAWLKRNSHVATLFFDSMGYLATRLGLMGRDSALWGEDFNAEDAKLGVDFLDRIATTAGELGSGTLFVYTTGQAQVISATYERPRSAAVVEEAARSSAVPWIDASKVLQQRPDRHSLYYKKNGHWTASGHHAIAQILANEIINQQWLETGLPADSTVRFTVPQ